MWGKDCSVNHAQILPFVGFTSSITCFCVHVMFRRIALQLQQSTIRYTYAWLVRQRAQHNKTWQMVVFVVEVYMVHSPAAKDKGRTECACTTDDGGPDLRFPLYFARVVLRIVALITPVLFRRVDPSFHLLGVYTFHADTSTKAVSLFTKQVGIQPDNLSVSTTAWERQSANDRRFPTLFVETKQFGRETVAYRESQLIPPRFAVSFTDIDSLTLRSCPLCGLHSQYRPQS